LLFIFISMSNELLFVYGTLLSTDNEFGKFLADNCIFYAHGKFRGELYNIGEYPGALSNIEGDNYVLGSIYKLINTHAVLKFLDEYEGISVNDSLPHEYTREMISIETVSETVNCWTYLYNWPVIGLTKIAGGNYLQYLPK
jgi:gamma-glutamylcyclotransferase (GGCT)/AIG2-like uncharacterized protein YtfP